MNDLNALTGLVRRCVEDYDMIAPGDTVAVGVSGGKDSLVLLMALNELRRYYPKPFALEALEDLVGRAGVAFPAGPQVRCNPVLVTACPTDSLEPAG